MDQLEEATGAAFELAGDGIPPSKGVGHARPVESLGKEREVGRRAKPILRIGTVAEVDGRGHEAARGGRTQDAVGGRE